MKRALYITRTNTKKTESGFTLIELMAAMTILSLGLFSVIHLQVVTIRGNAYARERTEAFLLANGVIEEIRTRALAWIDEQSLQNKPFNEIFPKVPLLEYPVDGVITQENLQALQEYRGLTIAESEDPVTARPINIHGFNPVDFPGLEGSRAIYRVHYVAHQVPLMSGERPNDDLIRMTVFVSWNNKDHGLQSFDWGASWDNFWDRHMVVITCFLSRARYW